MFYLGERTPNLEAGRRLAEEMIATGQAKEKFRQSIRLQNGDERVIDEPHRLPQARSQADVLSPASGFISGTNGQRFGIALAILGGGREKKEDTIDPAVGLQFHKRIGDQVEKGESLATISYNAGTRLAEAIALIAENYFIGQAPEEKPTLIRRILGA
jgi:thymidine phosphorylase